MMRKVRISPAGSIALVAAGVVIGDQLTKAAARGMAEPITILPGFLSFSLSTNTGAGFGILSGYNTLLIVISLLIIGGIGWYALREKEQGPLHIAAFGLILGGAAGNLIDRIVSGRVTDFIMFAFWPSFNLADAAISIGAVLVIFLFWKRQ